MLADHKSHSPEQDVHSLFPCLYRNGLEVNNTEWQWEFIKPFRLFAMTVTSATEDTQLWRACGSSVTGRFLDALLEKAHSIMFAAGSSIAFQYTQDFSTNNGWNLGPVIWGVTPVYRVVNIWTPGSFVEPGEKLPLNSAEHNVTPSGNFPKALKCTETSDPSLGWSIVSRYMEITN